MAKNNKAKGGDQAIEPEQVLRADNNTKLDAIKEIIFGQNMREYEEEFNELRTHINTNLDAVSLEFSKIRTMMEEMEERLTSKINQNHQAAMDQMNAFRNDEYSKTIKTLQQKLESMDEKKADRKKIGKMLTDIGNKLSS